MESSERVKLQVFVKYGCETCDRARQIAEHVDAEFPKVAVEIVDMNEKQPPREDVFAVPTYVLDDQVLSLGNPQEGDLREEITQLLRDRGFV